MWAGPQLLVQFFMQDKKIVANEAHKLNFAKLNYHVHEKELLVVIHS